MKHKIKASVIYKGDDLDRIEFKGHYYDPIDCAYMSGNLQCIMQCLSQDAQSLSYFRDGENYIYAITKEDRKILGRWLKWFEVLCKQDKIKIKYLH